MDNLQKWWEKLDSEQQNIFKKSLKIVKREPTFEELEKITNLDNLNCSDTRIKELSVLIPFKKLKVLKIHQTSINDFGGYPNNHVKNSLEFTKFKKIFFAYPKNTSFDISLLREINAFKKDHPNCKVATTGKELHEIGR